MFDIERGRFKSIACEKKTEKISNLLVFFAWKNSYFQSVSVSTLPTQKKSLEFECVTQSEGEGGGGRGGGEVGRGGRGEGLKMSLYFES